MRPLLARESFMSKAKGLKRSPLILNKRASFLYHLKEKMQAGLVLKGSEVKSLRQGRCQLKDAYIEFRRGEAFLQKAHISPYEKAPLGGHSPERPRKLLLSKAELRRAEGLAQKKGLSFIPLKIHFPKGFAKVEIALAEGKKHADKREALKKKEAERKIQRARRRGPPRSAAPPRRRGKRA